MSRSFGVLRCTNLVRHSPAPHRRSPSHASRRAEPGSLDPHDLRYGRRGSLSVAADMTTFGPIASKIARLIPHLASEYDGEVVATVRAIERTLKGSGFDFHNLADALDQGPPPKGLVDQHEDRKSVV